MTENPERSAYDGVACIYDWLGILYSWGAISRAKLVHTKWLRPAERVLYVGAGTASEAVVAGKRGIELVLVDASLGMLKKARARLESANIVAIYHHLPLEALPRGGGFTTVVAPFFLNTIREPAMSSTLEALIGQLLPGGRLVCVDFRGPAGGLWFRCLQRFYYLLPQLLFAWLTRNPWHTLYDYNELVKRSGLPLQLRRRVLTTVLGLGLFETLEWQLVRAPLQDPRKAVV